jgi:hypothetical protein
MDGKNSIFIVMPIVIMLCLIILVALPVVAARPPRHPDGGRVQFRHDDATPPQAGGRPPDAQLPPPRDTPASPASSP